MAATTTVTATAAAVSYLVAIHLPEDLVANQLPEELLVTTVDAKRAPETTYPAGFSGDGFFYTVRTDTEFV